MSSSRTTVRIVIGIAATANAKQAPPGRIAADARILIRLRVFVGVWKTGGPTGLCRARHFAAHRTRIPGNSFRKIANIAIGRAVE
jgi:hypothetical protein